MVGYTSKIARGAFLMVFPLLSYGLLPASLNRSSWLVVPEARAGQANLPDLVVSNVSDPPERGNGGFSFWVNNTVTNVGTGNANSSVTQYHLYDIYIPSDVLVGSRTVRNLKKGTSYTGPTIPVTIPTDVEPGTYYLIACADGTNSITESNESNNCASSTEPITVLAAVTLTAAIPTPPDLLYPGDDVIVTWTEIANPSAYDWIGLYTPGSSDIEYIALIRVNCTQTPTVEVAAGSCPFPIPSDLPQGEYEFRLFAGPISATSNSIWVSASTTLNQAGR